MPIPQPTIELRTALDRWAQILPKLLGAIVSVLITISFLRILYYKYQPFHLEHGVQLLERFGLNEMTFAAWFSSCMLMLCGVISAGIATISYQRKARDTWRWWGISVIFVAMSSDEALAMHEMLIGPIRNRFQLDGFLVYSWVLVAIPFLVVLTIVFGPLLGRLPRYISGRLMFATAIYFGGAVGIEMLGGKIEELFAKGSWVRVICGYLEEGMEMVGLVLGISALMLTLQWILSNAFTSESQKE